MVASITLVLLLAVACTNDAPTVQAVWLPDSDFPTSLVDATQPAQSATGVKHSVSGCSFDEELVYRVSVDNPYDTNLEAIIAGSLDGEGQGGLWGFFRAQIPPGRSTVILDTGNLPSAKRSEFHGTTLRSIQADFDITGCSAHLLGFFEGAEYKVVDPVAYRDSLGGSLPTGSPP